MHVSEGESQSSLNCHFQLKCKIVAFNLTSLTLYFISFSLMLKISIPNDNVIITYFKSCKLTAVRELSSILDPPFVFGV